MDLLQMRRNEKFRRRIKELRMSKGFTQQEMANMFNVSRPCICYWENGTRLPNYDTLLQISDFFGVTVDYLLGKSDSKAPRLREMPSGEDYEVSQYLDISKLNAANKQQLHSFFMFLLDKQSGTPMK